jgi:hypothetical protein
MEQGSRHELDVMMKLLAAAVLALAVSSPLLAGSPKVAPKPVTTAPEAAAAAAGGETKSDGAKARPVELSVSSFDVAGKSQRFISSKELVKVGPAKLVDPAQDLAGGLVAVDVQAGTKDGEPVWLRLAMQQGDVKKLASLMKSDDFEKLLLLVGTRVDASCSATRECCAKDDGNCTRMCCGQ